MVSNHPALPTSPKRGIRALGHSLALALMLGGLSACALPGHESPGKCWMDRREILSRVDLRAVMDEAARGLCLPVSDEPSAPLLVPDFVDIQTYKPDSVGVVMGEYWRSSLSRVCQQPIRQADLSRDFKLTPQGLTALTRDHTQVRIPELPTIHAMVGVYNWQEGKLTLVFKQVAVDTSTVQRVVSKEISWRCDTNAVGATRMTWSVR